MRVADVLLGLAGTKQHGFFDGMYSIRLAPLAGRGLRLGACSIRDARFNARSVCKVTGAYGIGKLNSELTLALSAWLSVGNRIPGVMPQD